MGKKLVIHLNFTLKREKSCGKINRSLDCGGSVDWVSSHKPKGRQFDSH